MRAIIQANGGIIMSINELFLKDEKRIKRLYKTALLAELLYFNYEYSSNKHDGIVLICWGCYKNVP